MASPDADIDKLMNKMEKLQTALDAGNGWEIERILEVVPEIIMPKVNILKKFHFLYRSAQCLYVCILCVCFVVSIWTVEVLLYFFMTLGPKL